MRIAPKKFRESSLVLKYTQGSILVNNDNCYYQKWRREYFFDDLF